MTQKLTQLKTVQEYAARYAFLPDVPRQLTTRADYAPRAAGDLAACVAGLLADYDAVAAQQRRLLGREVGAQLAAEFAAAADRLRLENAGRGDAVEAGSYAQFRALLAGDGSAAARQLDALVGQYLLLGDFVGPAGVDALFRQHRPPLRGAPQYEEEDLVEDARGPTGLAQRLPGRRFAQ